MTDHGFGESPFGEEGFGGTGETISSGRGLFGASFFGAEPFGGVGPDDSEPGTEQPIEAPDLVKSVRVRGPPSVRERFESHIKSPFDTEPETTWDRLLNTLSEEFEEIHTARDEAMLASYVDTAVGEQLDKIGSFVQLPRKHDETDSHYRGRLKVQLRVLLGGGSIEDIKETAAILLQTQPREITITEDPDTEPARFDIEFKTEYLRNSTVTVNEFVSFLDEVRAAGVRIFGTVKGGFEYRSVDDFDAGTNDPNKGYNNGAYAGLLID